MTRVTKYQISAINSYWEKYLGWTDRDKTAYPPPPSGSGGIKKLTSNTIAERIREKDNKENNNDSSNFDLKSNFDLELLTNSQNDTLITDLLANNDGFDDILRNINLNVFQGNIQNNSYTMMARQFPMTFITNSNVTISFNINSK
jgi:hypothetical protein